MQAHIHAAGRQKFQARIGITRQAGKQAGRQACRQTDRITIRQAYRYTGMQEDRHEGRQEGDSQMGRLVESEGGMQPGTQTN